MEGTAKALASILLGTTVQLDQSAQWNDHPYKYEATSSLGDDFDLVTGSETSHLEDDVCWINARAKICFRLPQSYSL